ncbi:LysR family transcriptional regulator, partial [Pseudomonas chlororaphis]
LAAHSALAVYLEEKALHLGLRMPIRIRANGFDGVVRMVARGAGLAVVTRADVEHPGPDASLTVLPLTEDWAKNKLLL